MNIKGGDGTIFGCGNCGKIKLKKRATSKKKKSDCEKIVVCKSFLWNVDSCRARRCGNGGAKGRLGLGDS